MAPSPSLAVILRWDRVCPIIIPAEGTAGEILVDQTVERAVVHFWSTPRQDLPAGLTPIPRHDVLQTVPRDKQTKNTTGEETAA